MAKDEGNLTTVKAMMMQRFGLEVKLTHTSGCGEVFFNYHEFKLPYRVSCFIRGVQAFFAPCFVL